MREQSFYGPPPFRTEVPPVFLGVPSVFDDTEGTTVSAEEAEEIRQIGSRDDDDEDAAYAPRQNAAEEGATFDEWEQGAGGDDFDVDPRVTDTLPW
jgi:hypothetical protein